jgi:hypothetical protein
VWRYIKQLWVRHRRAQLAANYRKGTDMDVIDDLQTAAEQQANGIIRYVRENPLAMVAGALILGALLARFAFLGNPKDAP